MTNKAADKNIEFAQSDEGEDAARPELDFSAYLPFRVGVLSQRLLREAASTYKKGKIPLTAPQWMVFGIVANYQPLVASEISRIGMIDEVGVSRAVAGLQKLHLVSRRRSKKDQRVLEVSLTESGEQFYREMSAKMRDQQMLIQSAVTPEEFQMFLGLIGRLDAVCASMADLRRIHGHAADLTKLVAGLPGAGGVLGDFSHPARPRSAAGRPRRTSR